MIWSEGNMPLKNPGTPSGIDPGTVWLVAQRLNHYATAGPTDTYVAVAILNTQGMWNVKKVDCLHGNGVEVQIDTVIIRNWIPGV